MLAFESDLLEYGDIFEGSVVIEAKTAELVEAASAELADVEALGGAFEAIDELKRRLVRSQAERVRRIESGEQKVVGVNVFTETAPSPLLGDGEFENILKVDHNVEAEQIDGGGALARRARQRGGARPPSTSCAGSPTTTAPAGNIMEATIALAHAGGTTGEWAGALREVFGEFRAPTGVSGGVGRRGDDLAWRGARCAPRRWPSARAGRRASWWPSRASTGTPTAPSRSRWRPATPASR